MDHLIWHVLRNQISKYPEYIIFKWKLSIWVLLPHPDNLQVDRYQRGEINKEEKDGQVKILKENCNRCHANEMFEIFEAADAADFKCKFCSRSLADGKSFERFCVGCANSKKDIHCGGCCKIAQEEEN